MKKKSSTNLTTFANLFSEAQTSGVHPPSSCILTACRVSRPESKMCWQAVRLPHLAAR